MECQELLKLTATVTRATVRTKMNGNLNIAEEYAQTTRNAQQKLENCPMCLQNFQKATDPLSFYEAFSSGFSGILVDITISIRN